MKKIAVGSALLLPVLSAHAALPAGVDTAFTDLQTDAATLFGYAMPVVISIAVAFWALKMVRRLIKSS